MNIINRILGRMAIGVRRFPVTALWCVILFLVFAWASLTSGDHQWLYPWKAAGFGGAALSLCLALASEKSGRYRWASILSFPFGAGVGAVYPEDWPISYLLMTGSGMVLGFLAVSLFLLTDKERGSAVFPAAFLAFVKSAGVMVLTGISLSICFTALRVLLISGISFDWYFVLWEAAFFLVGAPLFCAWLPSKEEPAALSILLRQLTVRLFLPVYAVLLAILLGYVGKIIVLWDMPVGEMNWFASLSVLGYTFFYFVLAGDTLRFRRRLFLAGALLLVPIVAAQLVGVYIRLSAYGLTPARYASLLCTAFGIVTIAVGAMGKSVRFLYPLAAVLIFTASISPWNLIDLPMRDQQYRLQTVLAANGMMQEGEIKPAAGEIPSEDKEKLVSGYRYFRYSDTAETNGFSYQIANARALWELSERSYDTRYIQIQAEGPIPIEGWTTLQPFHGTVNDGKLQIVLNGAKETVDMGGFWQTVYDEHKDGLGMQNDLITYDEENRRFIFSHVNFESRDDGRLPVFHVEGYVLSGDRNQESGIR